jgi:hypothetical protein
LSELRQWTIRELANYQIGYNQRKDAESHYLMLLARQISYSAAAGHLKKGMTIEKFWPLKSKETGPQLADRLKWMDDDKRFPDKI